MTRRHYEQRYALIVAGYAQHLRLMLLLMLMLRCRFCELAAFVLLP